MCSSHRPCLSLDQGRDRLEDAPSNQGISFAVELFNAVSLVGVCYLFAAVCIFRERSFYLLPWVGRLFPGFCLPCVLVVLLQVYLLVYSEAAVSPPPLETAVASHCNLMPNQCWKLSLSVAFRYLMDTPSQRYLKPGAGQC